MRLHQNKFPFEEKAVYNSSAKYLDDRGRDVFPESLKSANVQYLYNTSVYFGKKVIGQGHNIPDNFVATNIDVDLPSY